MAEYETVICNKNEAFVYQIPARTSNRGYRAADWKLDEPDWTGRLRVVAKGSLLTLKLEDSNTADDVLNSTRNLSIKSRDRQTARLRLPSFLGELFAQCPVESYPSAAVEQVVDSSRYFVIRIKDGSGRSACIGLGFADRGDSFDLLVSLQDHFKHVDREVKDAKDTAAESASQDQSLTETEPKLNLAFKEGQTIKINITTKKTAEGGASGVSRPKTKGLGGASPFLPPPPSPSRYSATSNDATDTKCETGIANLSLGVQPKPPNGDSDWVSFE